MAFSLRRGKAAVLRAASIALIIILALVVAFVAWIVRSPLPKVNGELAVSGIQGPITIRRDDRGIPHIDASSESDLFFGQGFACAQDRLWQMDLLRRTAEGRLSEIVGPATLGIDQYMRTLGLGNAAQSDARRLTGAALLDAQAYAAGVNAAASSHPLPLEFRLLGYHPQPWTPADSIAIIKLMAQRLDDQWDLVMIKAALQRKIGERAADALMDNQVPGLEHYIPGFGSAAPSRVAARMRSTAVIDETWARYAPPLPRRPGTGSNNWAVAARHVTTGKPVLSNDTHLGHSLPSTYWMAQLDGAGIDVEGFNVPGIPGLALGHNQRIAFGVTSADEPVQDIFLERFRSSTSDEYLANGRWIGAEHRIERITVKGSPPVILDVVVTRHGPLLERHGENGNALAWTILRGGKEIELLRQLDRAANWNDFRRAASQEVGPVFNWAYADVDGNIGYQHAGLVPNRINGDGSLPVEGVDDRFAWHGFIPFERMPHALNPRNGLLATANNALVPARSRVVPPAFYDVPYRVHRIYDRLYAGGVMTPEQIGSIQADVYDRARVAFDAVTAQALANSSDVRLRRIGSRLAAWDGMVTTTSTVPTFLFAEESALDELLLAPKLGAPLMERYLKNFRSIVALERVLDGDWSLASMGITRNSILAAIPLACARAADQVHATANDGIDRIEPWGEVNAAIYDHPLGRAWPLKALLNIRPQLQPGDGFTVYAGKTDHGPAQRLVNDLSNWDNSSMLLTLGESGQYSDAHYDDQAADFLAVRWVPTPFTNTAVAKATRDTLVLHPIAQ